VSQGQGYLLLDQRCGCVKLIVGVCIGWYQVNCEAHLGDIKASMVLGDYDQWELEMASPEPPA
jgi:predicted nucleic acid-binding Zn finger protein